MDTTTSVDGGTDVPEPTETTEAVADDSQATQVVDDQSTSQANDQISAEAGDEAQADEPQADDVTEWAKKKGLPLDDPVKLANMVRESERKMHEALGKSRELETAATQAQTLDYTGDPNFDQYAATVNQLLVKETVRDFFQENPEAREYESKMAEIVLDRPHLQGDLDALYALARTDPSREAQLIEEGGRKALTNLAQKQQAVPPTANATNAGDFSSSKITPANVEQLVAENGAEWYEANRAEILRVAGMSS